MTMEVDDQEGEDDHEKWALQGRGREGQGLRLVRHGIVGGHVFHQGSGTASIKEVDRYASLATTVGGSEGTVEIGCQVDGCAIVGARSQDTGDGNACVGLRVWELLAMVDARYRLSGVMPR